MLNRRYCATGGGTRTHPADLEGRYATTTSRLLFHSTSTDIYIYPYISIYPLIYPYIRIYPYIHISTYPLTNIPQSITINNSTNRLGATRSRTPAMTVQMSCTSPYTITPYRTTPSLYDIPLPTTP